MKPLVALVVDPGEVTERPRSQIDALREERLHLVRKVPELLGRERARNGAIRCYEVEEVAHRTREGPRPRLAVIAERNAFEERIPVVLLTVNTELAIAIYVGARSEENTSELQSRFGISYAVFCL